ncbi:hypothetical protein [Cellulophaga sp. L1A9]|uniref:hypothetical protein n=1 Tax=Cellulophaga sp. L1A9 TaxID=2686362 RepID=UPI00131C9C5E|nr:hypothetical protein [Cellulophaga sp. L1A9]
MKKVLFPLILVAFIGLLFFTLKPSTATSIEKQWKTLLESTKPAAEKKALLKLIKIVNSEDGNWEVQGIMSNGTKINMTTFTGDLEKIKSIAITFYWDHQTFRGKNWTPLDKNHCFLFFREE